MKYAHGVEIKNISKIWRDEVCSITRTKKTRREQIKRKLEPILQKHLDIFEEAKAESSNRKNIIKVRDFITTNMNLL